MKFHQSSSGPKLSRVFVDDLCCSVSLSYPHNSLAGATGSDNGNGPDRTLLPWLCLHGSRRHLGFQQFTWGVMSRGNLQMFQKERLYINISYIRTVNQLS